MHDAGYEDVTAAERAAAAAALGITVPAWKTGQQAYFDLSPGGHTDANPCVLRPTEANANKQTHQQACVNGDHARRKG